MESFRILALLCFLSGLAIWNTNAQESSELKHDLSIGSTTKSTGNQYTSFSQEYSLSLFRETGLTLRRYNIREMQNYVFLSKSLNYNGVLKSSIDNGIKFSGESLTKTYSGTFNGKWERLTGKSIVDTSRVYNSPLRRTNNPTFYDSQFYRTSAIIYNMLVIIKYPYPGRSK